MDTVFSISEIESQFDSEWVLVEDPQTNDALEVQSGKVMYHSGDRDEFDHKVLEFRLKRFAVLFTGEWQEDMELVL